MTKDINVTLHADKPYANQDITVTQGDFGFNIKAKIVGMDLANTTASIVFVKPVGIVESNQLTLQNDTYTYVVHGTEFDTPGVIVCDLKIRDNDTQRVSTSRFQILCIEDTLNGASDEPHSYSDTIAQIAERLEGEVDGLSEEVDTLSQTVSGVEGRIGEVEADVAEIAESIPTKLSELEDDATHRTVTDVEKNAWNNKSDFSGDYEDLDNKPTIPSKTSDLDNDSNFVSDASYVHTENNYSDADKLSVGEISGIKQDLTQLDSDLTALETVVGGKANQSDLNALDIRVGNIEKETSHIYGFHVNSNESDPSACVTYIMDAVGMTPAHMDYANSRFDYGSWKDAFFMPRPCMLKSNGQVDYYLNPYDFTKK